VAQSTWFSTMTFELATAASGWTGAASPMTLTRQLGSDADQVFTAYRTGAVSASLAVHLLDKDQKHVMTVTLTNARLTRYTSTSRAVCSRGGVDRYNDIKVETENTGGGGTTT